MRTYRFGIWVGLGWFWVSGCQVVPPSSSSELPTIAGPSADWVLLDLRPPGEDAGCELALEDLVGNDEVILEGEPIDCDSPDAAEIPVCGIFRAQILPTERSGPVDADWLDDGLHELQALITVRAASTEALCENRWIVFDSGGYGDGYGPKFGFAPPGHYLPDGDGYGDDLIRSYNDEGYVTVDITYDCASETPGDPCFERPELSEWLPDRADWSRSWFANTEGGGFVGAASRSRAIYEWAYEHSGRTLCAHAHSSGSGRLIHTLTRYGVEDIFDTVVFDGGPVMAYIPWWCGVDDGVLGPAPAWFGGQAGLAGLFDCAMSGGDTSLGCDYDLCQSETYDEEWILQSSLVSGDSALPNIDLSIVLGGDDTSGASRQILLWLNDHVGLDGTDYPPLSGRSLTLSQGYCDERDLTFDGANPAMACAAWDPSSLPTVGNLDRGYDARLIGVPHEAAEYQAATEVMRERMLETCEL